MSYKALTNVLKLVFILSHGQVTVEREFSVNSGMLFDNIKEFSLILHCLIKDYLVLQNLKLHEVNIQTEMIQSVCSSHLIYLEEQKLQKKKAEDTQLCLLNDEIALLHDKKNVLKELCNITTKSLWST